MDALKETCERAEAAGWTKLFGSRVRGSVAYEKDGAKRAIVVSLVDKDGYELQGKERTGRRVKWL